jgi:hypothetical protein
MIAGRGSGRAGVPGPGEDRASWQHELSPHAACGIGQPPDVLAAPPQTGDAGGGPYKQPGVSQSRRDGLAGARKTRCESARTATARSQAEAGASGMLAGGAPSVMLYMPRPKLAAKSC